VAGEYLFYYHIMTRVYIADSLPEERSALRLLLLDLEMEVVGEASDWLTTFTLAPTSALDMLLIDWDLLPAGRGVQALAELRQACINTILVVLISHLDARKQAALAAGANIFISKSDTPDRIAERLLTAAKGVGRN
jgi:DNA-binding NarL/FixJ family response regulator